MKEMGPIYYFVQVRLGSSRLPEKVLAEVGSGVTVLELLHRRLSRAAGFAPERTYFLTTVNPKDGALVAYLERRSWRYLRGEEDRVFFRFRQACERLQPAYFFRICSDNPFLEPRFLDALAQAAERDPSADYLSYADGQGTPAIRTHFGFFAELVKAETFMGIDPGGLSAEELEHVTPVFYRHPERFQLKWLPIPEELDKPGVRLTVDTPADLAVARKLFAKVGESFDIYDVYRCLRREPELLARMQGQVKEHPK